MSELVTFQSPPVRECRDNCNKICCISCEHFLSATVDKGFRGMLLDLACSPFVHSPTDMWAGSVECDHYVLHKSELKKLSEIWGE